MPKVLKKTSKRKSFPVQQKVGINKNQEISLNLTNIIAMIIVIVIAGLLGWGFDLAKQNKAINKTQAVAATQSVAYDGQDGKNALDLLKDVATIQTQDSSMGIFVTAINGIEDTNTQYWMFYVNGELAPVASDQYQTKNGDRVEWRYEDIGNFQ